MDISSQPFRQIIIAYLKPQWRRAAVLALLVVTGIGLQLSTPLILRYFIDAVTSGATSGELLVAALAFLGAGLLNQTVNTSASYLGAHVGWAATNLMRQDLAAHCLRLDMAFHNERTPGELIERIDGDVTALANFFSQFIVRIASAALLIVGVLVLLFIEDWRAGAALSLYVVIAGAILLRMRTIAVDASELERAASAELYGFVEERLAGLDDIRANGAGAYVVARFTDVIGRMFRRGRQAWMQRARLWLTTVGLFMAGDVLSLATGITLFRAGAITLGTVYLFYQYMQMMWGVIEQITHQLQDLQKAAAGLGRIEELRRIQPVMIDGTRASIPSRGALALEFDDVSFAYGSSGAVLRGVSFELAPGTTLGLLGRTGSGKTSLTRLIFRLYDPTAGAIRVGGVDIRDVPLGQLRERVAMVTQEVQLFHATVRDNLTFFDRSISDDRIHAAIAELGLDEWYESMPEGLDTLLSAGGGGLSAGEAQLVAFTRVLLQDPGLIILDEPSSRLDLATERLLERSMRRLLTNKTAIIIAHRLSTVRRADEIMVLETGRIVEHGRREELERDATTRFHRLLRHGLDRVVTG
jgi:ABC-type multidrug transport system fused ATPase/permease subunit